MNIALFGNPNTGKSSIFNLLTGLNQHVGNFPGVTVDKKSASLTIDNTKHTLIDFPGCYSIYPHSKDESVVYDVLKNPNHKNFPDIALIVVDAGNLNRNLLLFTQIQDLGIPCLLILNQWDTLSEKHIDINVKALSEAFNHVKTITLNARRRPERSRLINAISSFINSEHTTDYKPDVLIPLEDKKAQEEDAKQRYKLIHSILHQVIKNTPNKSANSFNLDKLLTHKIWGYAIFIAVLTVIFQFIYSFASYPMDWIDEEFGRLSSYVAELLPPGIFTNLLTEGIISGIGGVIIFIPQIALLFLFIALLEESGYMSRVVFIMDKLMRPFGLNGKSVVPLISSIACAIPGVMASRTIGNWKDRIITIMVAPLMSCSARIPVYTLLIALVIPQKTILGFLNLQGLVLLALYLLGIVAALFIAFVLKLCLKTKNKGFLILEMPDYKLPSWQNIGFTVYEKVKVFVIDAGKVILAISIVLWALASYGPGDSFERVEQHIKEQHTNIDDEKLAMKISSAKLEQSYIGILGKTIEPAIAPLGYDWKMGISLITSFAAREVFVGSLATIYAVEDDGENLLSLQEKLKAEIKPDGTPRYSLAAGLSLMVFYVFAMQCMATLAVVKRETKSWFWPLAQLIYMGILAYSAAFITFNCFS